MFRNKKSFERIILLFFSFESSESYRFSNYLHDSNSIFRVGRTNKFRDIFRAHSNQPGSQGDADRHVTTNVPTKHVAIQAETVDGFTSHAPVVHAAPALGVEYMFAALALHNTGSRCGVRFISGCCQLSRSSCGCVCCIAAGSCSVNNGTCRQDTPRQEP